MTTKLSRAYTKGKNSYYYFQCKCGNTFVSRGDKKPNSCGCINQPKETKRCYMCKEEFPLSMFSNRCSRCKDCAKEYSKAYKRKYQRAKDERAESISNSKTLKIIKDKEEKESRRQLLIDSPTKTCIKCGITKSKSEFYRDSKKPGGYDDRCRECERERLRSQRGYSPKIVVTDEEKRIRKKLQKHKRRFVEQQGKIKPKEIKQLMINQKHKCYWCSTDIRKAYHIDHYVPLSKGGEHTIYNVVLTCPTCNMSKHNQNPYEYANKIGRLL